MNSKRLYYILVGLLIVLGIGIFASANEANSLLEKRSKTLVSLKAQDQATANQKIQLTQDKKDIAKYTGLNTIAESVVPQDKDQAEAVRQIVDLATQSGIPQLSSITFPTSTLGGTTTAAPAAGSSTTTPATPAKPTNGGLTQVTPVTNIPGVYDLQITVSETSPQTVPYANFTKFLANLQQNRRTAQVSSITVEPDPKHPSQVGFTLIIDEYIRP